MTRGKRKRGAFDITVWLEDGVKSEMTTRPDRVFTNAEMASLIRERLLPLLEDNSARDAVGKPSEDTDGLRA